MDHFQTHQGTSHVKKPTLLQNQAVLRGICARAAYACFRQILCAVTNQHNTISSAYL